MTQPQPSRRRRILPIILLIVSLLAVSLLVYLFQITHTPYGRMDLIPALVIRMMPAGPMEFTPERRRNANEWTASMLATDVPDSIEIRELRFEGPASTERARVYIPEGPGPFGIVIWIHGGGFWMGEPLEDWDGQCAPLAADAEVIVVSIGYRLAPEHPFPAAVEDSWAGLLWAVEHAEDWGGDPSRIAVMGGSAGANLAAVVAQRALDENGPSIALQVLTVPTLNAGGEPTESFKQFSSGYGLDGMNAMRAAYFQKPGDKRHPWASPLLREDLQGLPPAVIHTAQFDPLRDEGEQYAERLRAAGVATELRRFDGAIHGFLGSSDAQAESDRAIANAVRKQIGPR
jgi:acetyl esterase